MKRILLAACVLAVSVAFADLADAVTSRYRNPTAGAELVFQIPGMHRARVQRNLTYARRANRERLRADVYRPRSAPRHARLPTVLLGGPPAYSAGKDSGQKVGWAQLISASGMAAVAFDIRSDNFMATPKRPAVDVAAAIRFVRANAARLGIDARRICTLGFSLGTAPYHLWAVLRAPQPWNRCNVVYYGPLDLKSVNTQIADDKIAEFSASTYLAKHQGRIPPMLVVKARHDEPGINRSIDRFLAQARGLGADVQLVVHETGMHGFDGRQPGARSRAIIKQTLRYFRSRLTR